MHPSRVPGSQHQLDDKLYCRLPQLGYSTHHRSIVDKTQGSSSLKRVGSGIKREMVKLKRLSSNLVHKTVSHSHVQPTSQEVVGALTSQQTRAQWNRKPRHERRLYFVLGRRRSRSGFDGESSVVPVISTVEERPPPVSEMER